MVTWVCPNSMCHMVPWLCLMCPMDVPTNSEALGGNNFVFRRKQKITPVGRIFAENPFNFFLPVASIGSGIFGMYLRF